MSSSTFEYWHGKERNEWKWTETWIWISLSMSKPCQTCCLNNGHFHKQTLQWMEMDVGHGKKRSVMFDRKKEYHVNDEVIEKEKNIRAIEYISSLFWGSYFLCLLLILLLLMLLLVPYFSFFVFTSSQVTTNMTLLLLSVSVSSLWTRTSLFLFTKGGSFSYRVISFLSLS